MLSCTLRLSGCAAGGCCAAGACGADGAHAVATRVAASAMAKPKRVRQTNMCVSPCLKLLPQRWRHRTTRAQPDARAIRVLFLVQVHPRSGQVASRLLVAR